MVSAVKGLKILEPALGPFVVPTAAVILMALFGFQRRGTAQVGGLFGRVMLLWFGVLAGLGLLSLSKAPEVLAAIHPIHRIRFFATHPEQAFLSLASVVLAISGREVLYANMGHCGRDRIRRAWFSVALPALTLNYLGQGALLLHNPEAIQNPFYLSVPTGGLIIVIILATVAALIASQAVISSTFSLTAEAVQLNFCPRLGIQYTSEGEKGHV